MQSTNCHVLFWSQCSIQFISWYQLSFVSICFNPKLQGDLWKLSPLQAVSNAYDFYDFWHPSTTITSGVNSNIIKYHQISIHTKITSMSCKVVCLEPFYGRSSTVHPCCSSALVNQLQKELWALKRGRWYNANKGKPCSGKDTYSKHNLVHNIISTPEISRRDRGIGYHFQSSWLLTLLNTYFPSNWVFNSDGQSAAWRYFTSGQSVHLKTCNLTLCKPLQTFCKPQYHVRVAKLQICHDLPTFHILQTQIKNYHVVVDYH